MEKDFPWHKVSIENNLFCSSFKDMFGTEMERTIYSYKWFEEKCKQIGMSLKRAIHSIGTLGGGKWLPPAQEYNLNILKPFLIGLELRKYRKTGRKGNASVRD